MPTNNYILTSNGGFVSEDEFYHHGILGMKWGVRRYQNEDGTLTAAGKRRQNRLENKVREARAKFETKSARQGNKYQSKYGEVLTRQTGKRDDPEARKKRIDADMKEADDRVKYYGSKRAAKAAIQDEAGFAKSVNRGRAVVGTMKYGTIAAIPVTALAAIATGGTGGVAAVTIAASYGISGAIMGAGAASANRYISKHANDQIGYTEDSEYGHDVVVTLKKR